MALGQPAEAVPPGARATVDGPGDLPEVGPSRTAIAAAGAARELESWKLITRRFEMLGRANQEDDRQDYEDEDEPASSLHYLNFEAVDAARKQRLMEVLRNIDEHFDFTKFKALNEVLPEALEGKPRPDALDWPFEHILDELTDRLEKEYRIQKGGREAARFEHSTLRARGPEAAGGGAAPRIQELKAGFPVFNPKHPEAGTWTGRLASKIAGSQRRSSGAGSQERLAEETYSAKPGGRRYPKIGEVLTLRTEDRTLEEILGSEGMEARNPKATADPIQWVKANTGGTQYISTSVSMDWVLTATRGKLERRERSDAKTAYIYLVRTGGINTLAEKWSKTEDGKPGAADGSDPPLNEIQQGEIIAVGKIPKEQIVGVMEVTLTDAGLEYGPWRFNWANRGSWSEQEISIFATSTTEEYLAGGRPPESAPPVQAGPARGAAPDPPAIGASAAALATMQEEGHGEAPQAPEIPLLGPAPMPLDEASDLVNNLLRSFPEQLKDVRTLEGKIKKFGPILEGAERARQRGGPPPDYSSRITRLLSEIRWLIADRKRSLKAAGPGPDREAWPIVSKFEQTFEALAALFPSQTG